MCKRGIRTGSLLLLLIPACLSAQDPDSMYVLTATVYNSAYETLGGTHVINMNSHQGEVCDELGVFRMPVYPGDTLFIRNMVYQDSLVPVKKIGLSLSIVLKARYYSLDAATIFPWGSSYGDFRKAIVNTTAPKTLSESLELPRQDPFYVPYDMDEEGLKSLGFMLTSPISYIYHNMSRREKNRRKVYWLERNRGKYEHFEEICGPENLSRISGLSGDELLAFMAWLYERMVCDFKCEELDIHEEVHALWKVYKELNLSD